MIFSLSHTFFKTRKFVPILCFFFEEYLLFSDYVFRANKSFLPFTFSFLYLSYYTFLSFTILFSPLAYFRVSAVLHTDSNHGSLQISIHFQQVE